MKTSGLYKYFKLKYYNLNWNCEIIKKYLNKLFISSAKLICLFFFFLINSVRYPFAYELN